MVQLDKKNVQYLSASSLLPLFAITEESADTSGNISDKTRR